MARRHCSLEQQASNCPSRINSVCIAATWRAIVVVATVVIVVVIAVATVADIIVVNIVIDTGRGRRPWRRPWRRIRGSRGPRRF